MIASYLRALLASFRAIPSKPRIVPSDPMAAAYSSAYKDVGEREDPLGSNSGAYVEGLRSEVRLPRLAGGEWCAVFCSVHMQRAGIKIKSRGAARLVNRVEKAGRRIRLKDLKPGMCGLSLHKRSGGGHVRIWQCYEADGDLVIRYVGGNERHQVKTAVYSAGAYVAMSKKLATI